ncbi:MAG: 50S ribosomal protein L29 [Clostridiales Family XIII bacterium]|jgi:large subunit ribosomal protein L29|nr:50S ribosomal protein L29 [Clostridiales Family XIII bacterium]
MNSKLEKFREMTNIELEKELMTRKEELFNLRFQHVTGQLENPLRLREVRRELAKIKTIKREKEIKGEKVADVIKK